MSGVEIEFSVEGGESSTQDGGGSENEAGGPRIQAGTAAGGASRIQGERHNCSGKPITKLRS